jgi:hypothetical protein
MLSLEESLKHYTVQQLRKEIANYNKGVKIIGYTKLQKNDLEKLILMNKSKFMHLVLEKAPEKKEATKKEVKKKEVMKKEAEGRIVQKVIMSKKVVPIPEAKKEEPKKKSFDTLSGELQQLIYITTIDKIGKALRNLNFRGKIQTNKILLNMQLLQNFKTADEIEKLINELKK